MGCWERLYDGYGLKQDAKFLSNEKFESCNPWHVGASKLIKLPIGVNVDEVTTGAGRCPRSWSGTPVQTAAVASVRTVVLNGFS